jgi:hypothetical protein
LFQNQANGSHENDGRGEKSNVIVTSVAQAAQRVPPRLHPVISLHQPHDTVRYACTRGPRPIPSSSSPQGPSYHHPPTAITTMSQNRPDISSSSNYQLIFDNALQAYKKKTGKDLTSDPLLRRLESCNSPHTVLALLREQVPGLSGSSSDGVTKWLDPTVNVLFRFSSTIGGAVSLVSLRKFKVIHQKTEALISKLLGLPTSGSDLHGHCLPSLCRCDPVTSCVVF